MRRATKGPTSKRYSEAFKRAIVMELEKGQTTVRELRKRYGIKGGVTIAGWVRRYGSKPMKKPAPTKNAPRLSDSQARLARENRELKAALAQVTMEKVLLESLIVEAEERLEVDLKKSFGLRR